MRYPKQYALGDEPEEVRVGDLIWWNEGVGVGFIEEVIEERSDFEAWGIDKPSIALSNLHPFAANEAKHKQHIGFAATGGSVVQALDDQEDDGIGLLSDHERSELEGAITEARSKVTPFHRDLPFCVSAVMDMERREEDWHFHFVDREYQIIETVVVPFRPNTRTKRE
ncbi:hypothetical protein JIN85_19415 [Luteolibacter pohnpeiensis]|uniref:Uncharacterized protein n=1 Tax=Luteolibacter pohnpeiensis TaxID=454153 RepID=A0A934SB17_9BACT|nr:hypothetical protein [Luteolibacter pohnpeiensis]MBK1884594.1 hypothetical protein [Luteolibacter pohnpeiensis]